MAVRVLHDERVYHSPTSQFHELKTGQIIAGDLANYLEANTAGVVEPAPAGDTVSQSDAIGGGAPTLAEGATGPGVPAGIGTDPVLTPDAYLSPLSYENALQRAGAAYFSPDTSLPPGTPDPVQLAQDGRSAMAVTVPVTVTTDSATGQIPGAGNQNRATTQIAGRQPNGANIVSEFGSDEGPGVVVVPTEPYNAVLVEPVTSGGQVVSQSAPLIEGAATPATAVDGDQAGGAQTDGVEVADAPGPVTDDRQRLADPDPRVGAQEPAGDSADDPPVAFDPQDHTVREVIAYAEAHPEQRAQIRDAELAGKGRTTILNDLAN